jgi:hypothetical protein
MQQTNLVVTMVSVCWAFLGTGHPGATFDRATPAWRLSTLDRPKVKRERLERNPNLILLSQQHFPTSTKKAGGNDDAVPKAAFILTAITGVLTPTFSIPGVDAILLLRLCQSDGPLEVVRQAVATVIPGQMSGTRRRQSLSRSQ